MLQRNMTAYTLLLPTVDPPREVEPGGTVDWPDPLAGFEAAEEATNPAQDPPARRRGSPRLDVPTVTAEEATL